MLFGITAMILVGLSWLFWGIIMGRTSRDQLDAGALVFVASLVAFVVSMPLALMREGLPSCDWKVTAWVFLSLFLSGVINNLQLVFMAKAMATGPNGIIWSLTQSGFILPFFIGIVGFHEPAGFMRGCGFTGMLTAIFLIGVCKDNNPEQVAGKNWKTWAFLAFFMTGISQTLSNLPSYYNAAEQIGSIWRTAFCMAGMMAGTPVAYLCTGKKHELIPQIQKIFCSLRAWKYCMLMELFDLGSNYFLLYPGMNRLVKVGAGAIAYPLMVSSCILGFEVYSVVFLREKRTMMQWLALLLCLAGVIGITLK